MTGRPFFSQYHLTDIARDIFAHIGLLIRLERKMLGIIAFPEQPANATFGGADMKTLYVTARTSLYMVRMDATGHRFAGGK